jgi:hypothetical protein
MLGFLTDGRPLGPTIIHLLDAGSVQILLSLGLEGIA